MVEDPQAPRSRSASPAPSDGCEPALDDAVGRIAAQLAVVAGRSDWIAGDCEIVARRLAARPDLVSRVAPPLIASVCAAKRAPGAPSVVGLLLSLARASDDPAAILVPLLCGRGDDAVVELTLEMIERGRVTTDEAVLAALQSALEARSDPAAEAYLHRLSGQLGAGSARLLAVGVPQPVRRLAARLLDLAGPPADAPRMAIALGADAARSLMPLLEFTRATHDDLVQLSAQGFPEPHVLSSFAAAAETLGPEQLGRVIAALGWPRASRGVRVESRVGVTLSGSFPLAVPPSAAELIEASSPAVRTSQRWIVVAHGEVPDASAPGGTDLGTMRRFRAYNLIHAEMLGEILEVAPVTPVKARRILALADEAVESFTELFSGHDEDAALVRQVYEPLRREILASIAGLPPDRPLTVEATRRIQMFEDPAALHEVNTLHGLKRWLHQRGLRNAFRLFQSGAATNRSVDLAVLSHSGEIVTHRVIRYLDFEPDPSRADLPCAVALLVAAFVHQLAHGVNRLPSVEALLYGNEVQLFIRYRNHPAFVRIDLSPPLRGGMVDLEYFAVSQFELDHHPAPDLPAIRHLLHRLGFFVAVDGLRLHARFDKEQAQDLADLLDHVSALLCLVPYLMDLDWTLGALAYPSSARGRVIEAVSEFFADWRVLPFDQLLTLDGSHLLAARQSGAAATREIAWDGVGEVRLDAATRPPGDLSARIERVLAARGIDVLRPRPGPTSGRGQVELDRAVLEPLRRAVAAGEVEDRDGVYAQSRDVVRVHEAAHLGALLAQPSPALREAACLADELRALEKLIRLEPSGTINGYTVSRGTVPLRDGALTVAALRDAHGVIRLVQAASGRCFLRAAGTLPTAPADNAVPAASLLAVLRRDNYLTGGSPDHRSERDDPTTLAAEFRQPCPHTLALSRPGERIVAGMAASPGRATGPVSFASTADGRLDGAVLAVAELGPAQAPLLRRAAAIVSTSGGALSHLATVALELGRPSLIVAGTWHRPATSAPHLNVVRAEHTVDTLELAGYRISCWARIRDIEETVREGDLVVVDADTGSLWLLGGDHESLGLFHGLRQLRAAIADMRRSTGEAAALEVRGRLLRAAHTLCRFAARTERTDLAAYLAGEILGSAELASGGAPERRRVLLALFDNPVCEAASRDAARRLVADLLYRLDALVQTAHRTLGQRSSPHEIAFVRLRVQQIATVLLGLDDVGVAVPSREQVRQAVDDVEQAAAGQLRVLRAQLTRDLAAAPAGDWRVAHLLAARHGVESMLAGPRSADGTAARAAAFAGRRASRRATLSRRRVLTSDDGGIELSPLIGAKAANLGEMARIIGPERVPPWFALTDAAFRAALRRTDPRSTGAARAGLGDRIAAVLGQADDPARQAAAVRSLWLTAGLDPATARAVTSAYRRLAAGGSGQGAPPMVAVRSSGREEDTGSASWAGQFDTFLCVRGEEAVLRCILLAWAGLWSERALHHRAARVGADQFAGGGVIVQRMVNARAAGVLHTVNAAQGDLDEMAINVALGLGEGVVSGAVGVDQVYVAKNAGSGDAPLQLRYVVGDKRERILPDDRHGIGTCRRETLFHQRLRPALEYPELCELVALARQLEAAYRQPLDIEFALEGAELFALQVRPVALFSAALAQAAAQRFFEPAPSLAEVPR